MPDGKKAREKAFDPHEAYDPLNPYAIGKKEYDDRYERLAKNAASWRRMAFLMLLLLSISTGAVLWIAQTVKVVPFIVQVDQHGYQMAVAPVEPSKVTDDRIIMARIADFITNMRSIYSDQTVLVAMISKTYDSIAQASPAQQKLDEYFRANNPLTKTSFVVDVTLQSVLRASPESNITWQAEWSEKDYEQEKYKGERFFKGMFVVEMNPPTDIKEIMRNPLGVFVSDFHITEKLAN